VNLCLYSGLFLLGHNEPAASAPPRLSVGAAIELQEAYKQALALALAWQPDVQLFGVTTAWQLASGDQLTLGRPAWSFSFYSPATRQAQTVIVDGNDAQAGRQQTLATAPQHVVPDWSLGSDELLLTFLSYGGEAFIGHHPQANIHLALTREKDGHAIWYITAVDPVTRQTLMVGLDAQTREIVVNTGNAGGG